MEALQVRELTRPEVAAMMKPKVSARQLQEYLNIARKYVPEFNKFNDPNTGRLKGMAKLYECHVPVLQEIRSLAREHTLADIESVFQQRASSKITGGAGGEESAGGVIRMARSFS
ncbi:MAG: hypothetical protein MET45_04875 [Nostoc sp. LLA-1]|nr:hypothetical protein [Cyanocohniella sp. LLY]